MNLKYFSDFVNEAKTTDAKTVKNPRIKLVLLTHASKESHTVPTFEAECKKMGVEFIVIDISTAMIAESKDGNFMISDKENPKGLKINADNTAIKQPNMGVQGMALPAQISYSDPNFLSS